VTVHKYPAFVSLTCSEHDDSFLHLFSGAVERFIHARMWSAPRWYGIRHICGISKYTDAHSDLRVVEEYKEGYRCIVAMSWISDIASGLKTSNYTTGTALNTQSISLSLSLSTETAFTLSPCLRGRGGGGGALIFPTVSSCGPVCQTVWRAAKRGLGVVALALACWMKKKNDKQKKDSNICFPVAHPPPLLLLPLIYHPTLLLFEVDYRQQLDVWACLALNRCCIPPTRLFVSLFSSELLPVCLFFFVQRKKKEEEER